MRKSSFAFALLLLGVFAARANAQERLTVNVPFDFVVRGIALPAGRYEVIEGVGEADPSVLIIRGDSTKAVAVALSAPADGNDPQGTKPTLVFSRVENRYVLSQVWNDASEGRRVID
jgi:hypothetical protein